MRENELIAFVVVISILPFAAITAAIRMAFVKGYVEFTFAWYDLWIGAFYDRKKQWVYIFPVPMFGVIIKIKP